MSKTITVPLLAVGILSLVLGVSVGNTSAPTVTNATTTLSSPEPTTLGNVTNAASAKKKVVTSLNVPESNIVFLEGIVNEASSKQLVDDLKAKAKLGKPLYLLINSPGGSVLDGALVISTMESLSVPVYTVCTQLCASMAFMIHQYGTKRLGIDRSILMAHPAAGGVQGTVDQMYSRLNVIARYVDKMDAFVAKRVGITPEQFHAKFLPELWLDAEDSVNSHFMDGLVNINTSAKPPAATIDIFGKSRRRAIDLQWL